VPVQRLCSCNRLSVRESSIVEANSPMHGPRRSDWRDWHLWRDVVGHEVLDKSKGGLHQRDARWKDQVARAAGEKTVSNWGLGIVRSKEDWTSKAPPSFMGVWFGSHRLPGQPQAPLF
jgi:hypothetical protein